MKQIVLLLMGASLLLGCQQGKISQQLSEVNDLVTAAKYDSAYQMVMALDEQSINSPEDKAHYALRKVQTSYVAGKPLASADSILDKVIAYYQQHKDIEKLADAYYYRAIVSYSNGDVRQTIQYYKNAEEYADQLGNLFQQYKVAEGITFVNRQCANYNLELDYAKKLWN